MSMSKIMLALDEPRPLEEYQGLVAETCGLAKGYKVGLPLLLSIGPRGAEKLRRECGKAVWVADLKLADIEYTMKLTVSLLGSAFDAVIAHAFIGADNALQELTAVLEDRGMLLALVYSMSHPGAAEVYDKCLDYVDRVVEKVRPWGLVAPATRPLIVERAKRKYPWAVVLSPGIGAQGAEPGTGACAGAEYEIVGRAVTAAPNPLEALREIIKKRNRRLSICWRYAEFRRTWWP